MKNLLKSYITNFFRLIFVFLVSFLIIILLWEILRVIIINFFGSQEMFFPTSKEILTKLLSLFSSFDAWIPIFGTFLKTIIALLFVTFLSVPIALFISKKKRLYSFIRPAWDFFRSIPPAMLFPVFLVVVGIGNPTKVLIAIYFSSLILTLNLSDSFISIFNQESVIWRHMKISKSDIYRYQIFPQMLDSFFSNLRITGSIIIAIIVIAEMYVGQDSGVGKALNDARSNYQWETMYSYIIVTGVIGMVLNYFIDRLHNTFKTT